MSTESTPQQYTFQAEIKQLLQLLSHSLYQSREIAIRELVSNASDALDKMRFVAMTDEAQRDSDILEIILEGRKEARELVIRDNGVGMTREELVTNLGTIAHSGSMEFLKNLPKGGTADVSLIGQFGRRVLLGVHAGRVGPGPVAELSRGVGLGVAVGRVGGPSRSSRPATSRAGPRSSCTSRTTPWSSPTITGSRPS